MNDIHKNWKCRYESGWFVLYYKGITYDINEELCNNEKSRSEWIEHLRHKNWWNPRLEQEFIALCKKHE
jgi:hypothetical protein